jgi:23S rRNA (adenine2030-N6)-methyltransferase
MAKYRVSKVDVESFRSIGRVVLEFKKPKMKKPDIWLFVGENNSGKTTVLKALEYVIGSKRESNPRVSDLHDYVASCSWNHGREQTLRIVAKTELVRSTKNTYLNNRCFKIEKEEKLDEKNIELNKKTENIEICYILFEPNEKDYAKHLSFIENDVVSEYSLIKILKKHLLPGTDTKNQLLNYLNSKLKLVPGVVECDLIENDDLLTIIINDGTKGEITKKAPGLQKMTLMYLIQWMVTNNMMQNYILGFDEPEAHLHPQSIKNIANLIKELASKIQVFATTHSPYFVFQASLLNVVRVVNRQQSAQFYGVPIKGFIKESEGASTYKYFTEMNNDGPASVPFELPQNKNAFGIEVTENSHVLNKDLIKDLLKRPNLQSELVVNSLFSSYVLITEGESEQIYIPALYRLWATSKDEKNKNLHEIDVHLISISGYDSFVDVTIFLSLFNIYYYAIIDNDSLPQRQRMLNRQEFICDFREDLFNNTNKLKVNINNHALNTVHELLKEIDSKYNKVFKDNFNGLLTKKSMEGCNLLILKSIGCNKKISELIYSKPVSNLIFSNIGKALNPNVAEKLKKKITSANQDPNNPTNKIITFDKNKDSENKLKSKTQIEDVFLELLRNGSKNNFVKWILDGTPQEPDLTLLFNGVSNYNQMEDIYSILYSKNRDNWLGKIGNSIKLTGEVNSSIDSYTPGTNHWLIKKAESSDFNGISNVFKDIIDKQEARVNLNINPRLTKYLHSKKAGNIGDVFKHLALFEIFSAVQSQKYCYFESHSGAGLYQLESTSEAEWRSGIAKVLDFKTSRYQTFLEQIKQLNSNSSEISLYPGSSYLAKVVLKPTKTILFENNADIAKILSENIKGAVVCVEDSWNTLVDKMNCELNTTPTHKHFVFIDPPYVDPTDWDKVATTSEHILSSQPSANIVIWYPIFRDSDSAINQMKRNFSYTSNAVFVECICLDPTKSNEKMIGSGLVLIGFTESMIEQMKSLSSELEDLFRRT